MSSPKSALNPRIKISKSGRPYIDVEDLVKARLERIEKARQAEISPEKRNGNTNGNSSNNAVDNPTPANANS